MEAPDKKSKFDSVSTATVSGAGIEDQPASLNQDKLGFAPYVEAVLSFLMHPDTRPPFTLSIEGDWGSGKSSFMLQLRQILEKNGHKTISFNAWRHDKVEAMWAAFALHFIRELSRSLSWSARIRSNIRLFWMRFNLLRAWPALLASLILLVLYILLVVKLLQIGFRIDQVFSNSGGINWVETIKAVGWVGVVFALLFFLKKVSEVTGNPVQVDLQKFTELPKYSGYTSFIEEFHQDFQKSVDILSGKHEKIFIFIDDLDRADVPKAAELMQGLNLMITDSPKLIFIIGMDREKVAAGIAAKYKDLLQFLNPAQVSLESQEGLRQAREFGYDFLEKFIQLSFKIPQPSVHSIQGFIYSLSHMELSDDNPENEIRYNPVLTIEDGKDSAEFQEVTSLVAPFFDYNPRRIKQFVNSFRLKAHIAHSTGLFGHSSDSNFGSLTIPQLGKFIAIVQKWPSIIDDLTVHSDLFRIILTEAPEMERFEWSKNQTFLKLLWLRPENNSTPSDNDYNMENVNITKLLEISPAVQPEKSSQTLGFSSTDAETSNNISPERERIFVKEQMEETPKRPSKRSFLSEE